MHLVPGRSTAGPASSRRLQALSAGRVLLGTAMVARPAELGTVLGVDRVSAERTSWAVQMLGVRDAALGAGALLALRSGGVRGARLWLLAGLVSDAVDALAVGRAAGRGTLRPVPGALGVGVAAGAVAVQAAALAQD